MNKTYRDTKDTKQTDAWIKDSGLNVRTFTTVRIEVVRAQMAAKSLLTEKGSQLDDDCIQLLHAFQRAAANGKKVLKITDAQCYAVLNLFAKSSRQLFKKHRHSRKKR